MVPHENLYVCYRCKPVFIQRLMEGAVAGTSRRIPPDCRKFKLAVFPIFIFTLVHGLLGAFGFALIIEGPELDPLALAGGGAAGAVTSLVLAWVLTVLFPVAVSAEGVYGYSFWGRRRFVRWHEIELTRKLRVFNLQWLRIYSASDPKVTWLGMFPAKRAEFKRELERVAPAGSPVLSYFKR